MQTAAGKVLHVKKIEKGGKFDRYEIAIAGGVILKALDDGIGLAARALSERGIEAVIEYNGKTSQILTLKEAPGDAQEPTEV